MDDNIMSNFAYNDTVLMTLMELGYIQSLLSTGKGNPYATFTKRLLDQPTTSREMHLSLVKGIGERALADLNARKEFGHNGTMSRLVHLLKDADDDSYLALCCKALAECIKGVPENLDTLLHEGGTRVVIPLLEAKDQELVAFASMVVSYCTFKTEHRKCIVDNGVMKYLLALLKPPEVYGAQHNGQYRLWLCRWRMSLYFHTQYLTHVRSFILHSSQPK